jgi:hypothetical protein
MDKLTAGFTGGFFNFQDYSFRLGDLDTISMDKNTPGMEARVAIKDELMFLVP